MGKPHKATLSVPVTVKAGAGEGETKGPPTFEAIAYSGAPVRGYTATPRMDADYVIDLAGMTKARNPKANLDHKANQRVGHITDFGNDGKQLTLGGALSAATTYRNEVAESAANGFEWDVSIEADLSKPRKIKAGETVTVNGRTLTGPLYVFAKSVLTDLAFVSHGASEGNEVRIAATAAGAKTMNEFETFAASCGVDLDQSTDDQKANLQRAFNATKTGGNNNGNGKRKSFAEVAAEEREENARQEQITKLMKDAMRECPLYLDQIEQAAEDAIKSKMSVENFELHLLRETRGKGISPRQNAGFNDPRVIEAAICRASGLPNIEKHYSEQVLDAVDRAGMQHFTLQSLLIQVANANGYSCRAGERIHAGNIRTVLEYCFPPVTARLTGFSTISLPNILGAVANKQLLAGYMEEDPTWREIARVRSVTNFHTQNHYRMLDSLEYEEVGPAGEIKHGTLGEETYTSQAKTYGKMMAITRTQIINDDLGAFDDMRERLGRGASKKFNNIFWAAFMNNASFFTTALTNYIEGATTNLGTDGVGLGLGVTAFRKMLSPAADGTKRVGVGMRPTKLLVPPELEFTADKLFVGGSPDAQTVANTNAFRGKYRSIVQNRLSDSAFTGNSTTAWYLFGDEMQPMLVTFLNGQQTPTVESTDADFHQLGIQFRGYHDFGCDKAEYLAGIKSKGAA